MAELVDALDLGSSGATRPGSSPGFRIENSSPDCSLIVQGRHVPVAPSSLSLRPATEGDVVMLVHVARQSWLSAFEGSAPPSFVARWRAKDREPAWYGIQSPRTGVLPETRVPRNATPIRRAGARPRGQHNHPRAFPGRPRDQPLVGTFAPQRVERRSNCHRMRRIEERIDRHRPLERCTGRT